MPSISLFYILVTAALLCTLMIPFIVRMSVRSGVLDKPDERKIHTIAVPRLGGIAIFSSLLFSVIYFSDINQQIKGFLAGAVIIFLTGLADDLANLSPRQKFAGEFLAAGLAVVMGGITVRHLGNPFGMGIIELGPLAIPFTVIGIVGLINAINLLDGLDGLAGGVCIIACVTFAIISFISGNPVLLVLSVALLGALLGFLRYNHHPAIIFMGDSGSLLLGYCMGVFSVLLATGGDIPVSPYIPLMILSVPILDTLVVMLNRRRAGKPLFSPDKTHLHHRLLELGFRHRATVLIVFGLEYLTSTVAVTGHSLSDSSLLVLLLIGSVTVYGALTWLARTGQNDLFGLSGDASLHITRQIRERIHPSGFLAMGIKLMLLAIMLLPVAISHHDVSSLALFPVLILIVSCILYFSRQTWQSFSMQVCIYISGTFMVLVIENLGRDETLFGLALNEISSVIFMILLVLAVTKILIRKRLSRLIVSPIEYLIMLIVLSVPLLPQTISEPFQLSIVAAKSVILFVSFKLVLMRQKKNDRLIILTIVVSALVLVLRSIPKFWS